MKKFSFLITILLLSAISLFAQTPEKFSYQAVVRNTSNSLVTDAQVGVRVSILQGSASGNAVYVETHTATTNTNGLLTVEIGGGSVQQGTFADIDWANGPFFLKTETDPNGGGSYTVTSTQQLLSVPYALYAKEAGNGFSGDYNDLTNKPTIPQSVSELANDANYITINDIPEIPTVPTNVSAFNNDAGYITLGQVPAQVNADWNATSGAAQILNKPTLFSGNYNDLTNTPNLFSGNYNDLTNKPNLSAVAYSGSYNDLTNKPSIPAVISDLTNNVGYITLSQVPAQVNADWNATSGAAQILNKPTLFSGDYNDLSNKPTIPTVPTDVSAFNNDAGYLTGYTETDPQFNAWDKDYNDLINKPTIPTIPTDVSAFNNDVGYITGYTETDPQFNAWDKDYNDLINLPQIPQVPTDVSAFNNNAGYITMDSVPAIPTNVSAFTNDAGYLTSYTETDPQFNAWDKDYNDLINLPQIPQVPIDVSAFNNDAGYITMNSVPAIPTDVSAFNNDVGYIINMGNDCNDSIDLCTLLTRLDALENQVFNLYVVTQGVTAATQNSFTVSGEVTTDGGSSVSQRGFVYDITHNPTIFNNKISVGSGLGTFSATISSLNAGTTYYVRAFATNSNGTFYGIEVAVTTTPSTPSTIPSITTIAVTNITFSGATVTAAVTSDGGEVVTQRGFVFDTLPNPTLSSLSVTHGTGMGQYSNLLTNLISGKNYYIRAFAQNAIGIAYGNELTFTTRMPTPVEGDGIPCPNTPTVTDHEGNVYNTVLIGAQCWTKENMRTTTSPSTGTYIVPPAGTIFSFSGKQARWYNNDSATYAPKNCGLLYNWNAAVDTFNTTYGETSVITSPNYAVNVIFSGNRRGICPQGWHIPSNEDWNELATYVSSQPNYISEYETYHEDTWIAKALCLNTIWSADNSTCSIGNGVSANNSTNFSVIPAGICQKTNYTSGSTVFEYRYYGNHAFFWCSTQSNSSNAINRYLIYSSPDMKLNYSDYGAGKGMCMSVRCLRD